MTRRAHDRCPSVRAPMCAGALFAVACSAQPHPFTGPPAPAVLPDLPCDGLTITQRIDLGGPWVTATSDGVGRMFLATANTIEVHDLDNPRGKPLVVQVDGTIHDVAFEAGALWIAAGRAGLARWRPADGAAPGSAAEWQPYLAGWVPPLLIIIRRGSNPFASDCAITAP